MAAPSYTEDLNDIATGDEAAGWAELTGTGVGDGEVYSVQGPPAYQDPDYPFIQGQYSVTQDCTKDASIGSLAYNAGGITIPTDGAVFVWQNYMVASNIYNYATGGFRICIGSGLSDFNVYFVGGVDKAPYPYGGWDCQVANPTVTRDDYAGTPTGTINYVGGAVYVVTGSSKGEVHNVDVMRYGRGSAIFTQGDAGNGYCTIAGFAAQNDSNTNRWGLIQETSGGYLWQGRMLLGTDAAAVDFRDSNKTIFVKWTPKVTYNFNTIEIKNIGSNVEFTGFTFQVLDITTASPGRLIMSDPADVAIDQCTFVDMGEFVFDTTTGVNVVEITGTTFRRCGQITQGGATFTDCSILNSDATSSILADNITAISGCDFQSDGLNHAIELDPSHAGGTYNLINCTYSGYATSNGSTGNEPLYNNSGGAVTINVTGGDYPYYRNGPGSTTNVVQSINWYFKIVDQDGAIVNTAEFRIYNDAGQQLFGVETSDGTEQYTFDGSLAGTNANIVVHDLSYIHSRQVLAHPASSNTAAAPVVISLVPDRVYGNATTLITETWGARPIDDHITMIDSYISLNNPDTNYGSSQTLKIGLTTDITKGLFDPQILFSNFPATTSIVSATLYLYVVATIGAAPVTITNDIYYVKREWVESQVTYNIYSTGNSWQFPGIGGANDADQTPDDNVDITGVGWFAFDVTTTISERIAGTITDFYGGWYITTTTPAYEAEIASCEYSNALLRPYLQITYTV